jgi:hypothetical protein
VGIKVRGHIGAHLQSPPLSCRTKETEMVDDVDASHSSHMIIGAVRVSGFSC